MERTVSKERPASPASGFGMLFVLGVMLAIAIVLFVFTRATSGISLVAGLVLIVLIVILSPGFFVVDPNRSKVLVLFGTYRGTMREPGFYWTNPFTLKKTISLRAHNLNGQRLKVNDLMGNPIEIAAIVVWQVRDTAQAAFDVESYMQFVEIQCESAVRLLASRHPYDDDHTTVVTTSLRGSADVVASELMEQIQSRLDRAGIEVIEARLSHLAYAPEIASAMLQRQQASAIIAARKQIVEGAVSMVDMALHRLAEQKVVMLDEERKATLVGNLLVVLCGHTAPQPVLNTGGLYS
jgi:regulator of protease activity HflC (stomatin/prohibitin superfamily)